MRVVGLTGGIATGKSTVARLLAGWGAAIVDADVVAREVVEPGQPALAEIAAEFGSSVLTPEGRLDRTALAAVVFASAERRRRLEEITHPRIVDRMRQQVVAALGERPPLVAVDIPLLLESGRAEWLDDVLLVYADPATQLRRLMERDGMDEAEARGRLAAQMPIDEKRRLATWVIDNSGTTAETEAQVAGWWESVLGSPPACPG